MGDLVSTTPKPISRDGPSGENSKRILQEAVASTWPSMVSKSPDTFPSETLPPLELDSRPMFAFESMVFKRDQSSNAISFAIHAVIITLVLSLALRTHTVIAMSRNTIVTQVDFKPYT